MEDMDSQNTSTEDVLQALLVRSAVMQANNDTMLEALKALQAGQERLLQNQVTMQVSLGVVQTEVRGLKERMTYYARHAEVESVRSDLFKALNAQTWRLFVWMTAVSSGLVGAVYYIARNVY